MKKEKIGVYICHCGGNISDYVDVKKVVEAAKLENGVFISKNTLFACSDSAQKEIADDITSNNLDSIIIASCSPKLHVPTFRGVAERAGLNPYNYVQVNIREQGSWAHSDDKEGATAKAIQLVKGSIARVRESKALEPIVIPAKNVVAVIGAGVGGMRSAIELANMGTDVYLIEREFFVGGRASQWGMLCGCEATGKEIVTKLYNEVISKKNITLFTGAEIIEHKGSIGNFELKVRIKPRRVTGNCNPEQLEKAIKVCPIEVEDEFEFGLKKRKAIYKNYDSEYPHTPAIDYENCTLCGDCVKVCDNIDLEQKEEVLNIAVGTVIANTGFDPYEPPKGEYAYNEISNVVTLQQFKRIIDEDNNKVLKFNGKTIHNIAYIYCVGSRQGEGGNQYCSRYCCTSAIHTSIRVKKKYDNINNFHFNRGIRTYGKQEIYYEESSKMGDIYIQSYEEGLPEVEERKGKTYVKVHDFLTFNKEVEAQVDLVVLITGMVPRKDNAIGDLLKIPKGRDGFFNEIHMKLRPVETVIDGVMIAGASQAPKNILETLNSSLAAASKANSILSKGKISLEPILASVDTNACEWCDKCTDACPFGAITQIDVDGKKVAKINISSCKGCGMCLPVCPTDAIDLSNFTNAEMESMINALVAK